MSLPGIESRFLSPPTTSPFSVPNHVLNGRHSTIGKRRGSFIFYPASLHGFGPLSTTCPTPRQSFIVGRPDGSKRPVER
jgi:hypothetical protein